MFDAFSGEMIIPQFGKFREQCRRLFDETKQIEGGYVSKWIPQLERVSWPPLDIPLPSDLAICPMLPCAVP